MSYIYFQGTIQHAYILTIYEDSDFLTSCNLLDSSSWTRPYLHRYMERICVRFEWNRQRNLGNIPFPRNLWHTDGVPPACIVTCHKRSRSLVRLATGDYLWHDVCVWCEPGYLGSVGICGVFKTRAHCSRTVSLGIGGVLRVRGETRRARYCGCMYWCSCQSTTTLESTSQSLQQHGWYFVSRRMVHVHLVFPSSSPLLFSRLAHGGIPWSNTNEERRRGVYRAHTSRTTESNWRNGQQQNWSDVHFTHQEWVRMVWV